MRILIVGSDANSYSLAKKFSQLPEVDLVFVAPGNSSIKDFATSIDILSTQVDDLLDFAKVNEINLTFIVDEEAMKLSITNLFEAEGLSVFAPSLESSRIVISKSSSKKTLYKLRIQTPKFGIFDKENMAIDYARKSRYPVVIKNDTHVSGEKPVICDTFSKAKNAIELYFEEFNKKIVIEDYIDAKEVSFYVITDGYTAFPLARVASRNLKDEFIQNQGKSDGKILNIAYSPDHYISKELESKIMSRVVYPVIDEISKHSAPYTGILGIDLLINGNNFQVLEFNSFFKSVHLQAALPLIKCNLKELAFAAINGSLSDDYHEIELSDKVAIAVEIQDNINIDSEDIENFEVAYSKNGNTILTATSSTMGSAKNNLIEFLESLPSDYSSAVKELCSLGERNI